MPSDEPASFFPPGIAGKIGGSGPDLIWTHGLTSSRAAEDEFGLEGVTSVTGMRVTRWDAPGHGESAPVADDETTKWPNLARLLLRIADGIGAEHFVAAGASMGTATSLWAAVLEPDRVSGLILVIPPTAWETRAAQTSVYLDSADRLQREGIGAYLEALDARPLVSSLGEYAQPMREAQRRRLASADLVSLAHVLRGAGASNLPAPAQVAMLDMPVLILAREGDATHPLSTAEELLGLLPQARLVISTDPEGIRSWRRIAQEWLDAEGLSRLD